jgi:hypothetical protein
MSAKSDVTRDELGVRDTIRSAFGFLLDPPYNLKLAQEDARGTHFEGGDVALTVFLDPVSYELDLLMWRPSDSHGRSPYSITDLMRVQEGSSSRIPAIGCDDFRGRALRS